MRIFCFLLCFVCFKTQAITVSAESVSGESPLINYRIQYEVEHYLYFILTEAQSDFKERLKKSDSAKVLKHLLAQAQKGDIESQRLLSFWLLDKQLMGEGFLGYKSYFQEIPGNKQIQKKIHSLFYDQGRTATAHFIEALKNYLHIKRSPPEERVELLRIAFMAFRKARTSPIREFGFLWAFVVLDYHNVGLSSSEDSVRTAKNLVFRLAQNDYAPAQYFQAFLNIKENNVESAMYWLEKSFQAVHNKGGFILLSAIYMYYQKDQEKAKKFLKKAIYEQHIYILNPLLLDIYMKEKKDTLALKLAKEIVQNYSNFPDKVNVFAFNVILAILSQDLNKNIVEALSWHYRFQMFAKIENLNIQNYESSFLQVRRQASPEQITTAKQEAHRAIFLSNIWESTNSCHWSLRTLQ